MQNGSKYFGFASLEKKKKLLYDTNCHAVTVSRWRKQKSRATLTGHTALK